MIPDASARGAYENAGPVGKREGVLPRDSKMAVRVGFEPFGSISRPQVLHSSLPPMPVLPMLPQPITQNCPNLGASQMPSVSVEVLDEQIASFAAQSFAHSWAVCRKVDIRARRGFELGPLRKRAAVGIAGFREIRPVLLDLIGNS